jgi:hypothetical protein
MGSFRRVEGEKAGSTALGILIPPSRRTFVIVRPRSLPWDLLLCRDAGDLTFREFGHDEASAAAHSLYRALCAWAAGGSGAVEVISAADGKRLRVTVGPFVLAACRRVPGQPYGVLVCGDDEAMQASQSLTELLCPEEGVEREVYFNTRFFERPAMGQDSNPAR